MSVLIVCQTPLNSWEPVDWWSRGQEVLPRLFIFQYISEGQAGSRAFEGVMAGREETGRFVSSIHRECAYALALCAFLGKRGVQIRVKLALN